MRSITTLILKVKIRSTYSLHFSKILRVVHTTYAFVYSYFWMSTEWTKNTTMNVGEIENKKKTYFIICELPKNGHMTESKYILIRALVQ